MLWADDFSRNLGVRVLARGAQALWERARPGDAFVHQDFNVGETGHAMDRGVVIRDALGRDRKVAALLDGMDVVLDTGAGDSFTDMYGVKRLALMTYVREAARRRGLPVVLMPQTIGPFRHRASRAAARRTLRQALAVVARDPVSARHSQALGRAVDCVSTDVVFALPVPQARGSRDVLLNVSGLLWHGEGGVDVSSYRALMHEIVGVLQGVGREVTLIAHVLDNRWRDNDVSALRQFVVEASTVLEVVIPEDLEDARSTMGGANLVIGSRMHACLNAISVGTPAIPLGYSRKFAPLMADLGWEHTIDLRSVVDVPRQVADLVTSGVLEGDVPLVRARGEVLLGRAVESLAALDVGGVN